MIKLSEGVLFASVFVFLATSPANSAEITTYQYDGLGRLISASTSGGPATGALTATSYDPAGNRTNQTTSGGAAPPPSTPPPGNTSPVANPDSTSQLCWTLTTKNVTANDTDAEGNYPLTLLSASSGTAVSVVVASASSIQIESFGTKGTFPVTYTIKDSLGATATGTLSVSVTGTTAQCSAPQQLQAPQPDSGG